MQMYVSTVVGRWSVLEPQSRQLVTKSPRTSLITSKTTTFVLLELIVFSCLTEEATAETAVERIAIETDPHRIMILLLLLVLAGLLSSTRLLAADAFVPMPVTYSPQRTTALSIMSGITSTTTALSLSSTSTVGETTELRHTFWGQTRSKTEVEQHVHASLAGIDAAAVAAAAAHQNNKATTVQVVSAEPPLVLMHDFLTATQCEALIAMAKDTGMTRSTTGNGQAESTSRTSSTVWLKDQDYPKYDCGPNAKVTTNNNVLHILAEKVSALSGLSTACMENLQVCRYEPGQEFKLHTDHQDNWNELECGGRLATCLIYLSEPAAGGSTWFPGVHETTPFASSHNQDQETQQQEPLQETIAPVQGSAVFFWNTIERPGEPDYDPRMFLTADVRMRHAGLPVHEGEKWVCNRWIHPVDFGASVPGLSSA